MFSSQKLTPLIFSFELPIVGTLQPLPDRNSPYLRSIQEKYNVHVMFRNCPKLYGTMVVVKGCEWEVTMVQEATLLVIKHMCDSLAVSNLNFWHFTTLSEVLPSFTRNQNGNLCHSLQKLY